MRIQTVGILIIWVVSASLLLITHRNAMAQTPEEKGYRHLGDVMDRYHGTFDLYTDLSAAGNHFVALGKMGQAHITIFPGHETGCFRGATCIENRFYANGNNWGGFYWQNGVLEGEETQPKLNWGTYPNAGLNLSGATRITFRARGAAGGEIVEFFAFGVGRNEQTGAPIESFPDSSPKVSMGNVTLSADWEEYSIYIDGVDLTYVLGGFGWVIDPADNNGQDVVFYLDDIRYERDDLQADRFLVSYETVPSALDFDTVMKNVAFTYDNSLVLIAFCARGKADDMRRAGHLADAIVYALDHDRYFNDKRLRNAYQGGDLVLFPGWTPNGRADTVRMPGWWDGNDDRWYEDAYAVSTDTGNMAWAIIALMTYYDKTGEGQYLEAARQMAEFVERETRDERGSGGYTGGYSGWEQTGTQPEGQRKLLWKSTEHNIDLYAAFSRLHTATGDPDWKERALHARTFVEAMWHPEGGHFWTGTRENGEDINTDTIPADVNTWSLMALGDPHQYAAGIDWVETHCLVEEDGFKGFDFNDDRDHIWFEGTAHMVLSYQLLAKHAGARTYLAELERAQGTAPGNNGDGLVAALHDHLTTGFTWEYFNRLHIGATAWFLFAQQGYNPYWGTKMIMGDIDGNGRVELRDAAIALQTISQVTPSGALRGDYTRSGTDVNGDFRVDVAEVIYVLQHIAGLR